MSLIDVKCQNAHVREVYRAAADWPATPVCPECGEPTEQIHLPKSVTWNPDPVIVFQAHDGSFRFPGDANGLSAKNYERQGFRRLEIRGATEMRRFEGTMNRHEYSRAARQVEMKQQQREMRESITRSDLRQKIQSMSPQGRAVAQAAMQRNDSRPKERAADANFHNQAYSFDRPNREESRGSDGRRRRD